MSANRIVSVLVEGDTDEAVIRRVLEDLGLTVDQVAGRTGKGHLDANLDRYNTAAQFGEWLVVRDLDQDAECGAALVSRLLPRPASGMHFRVAVRAMEAWLLADAEGTVSFFKVGKQEVPAHPEDLLDPKRALVDLARRSRSRVVRDEMVPAHDTTARVGPGFTGQVIQFAKTEWSWKRAMKRSESLRRCVACMVRAAGRRA